MDILMPPWSPSSEAPPPRRLKILGLIPQTPGSSSLIRPFPATFGTRYGITGPQTAGRLIHLTNQVFCRTVVANVVIDSLAATLPMVNSQQSSCPFHMRDAPIDVEANLPFREDISLGEKILLALQKSVESGPVYTDAIHAPPPPPIARGSGGPATWSWRTWLGPTVRRWQFENFRIRLQSHELRKISNFPVHTNM